MRRFLLITLFIFIALPFSKVFSATSTITFVPENPEQGEPVMIVLENTKLFDVKSAKIDGKFLKLFQYQDKPTAFYGIDMNRKFGKAEIVFTLKNGEKVIRFLEIKERKKIEEIFSIPKKLGGDTIASQKVLVTSLAMENAVLSKIPTNHSIYWNSKFSPPLKTMVVSDEFGYSRNTGGYVLTHKGTDLRAKEGTQVFAMNDGVVKVVSVGRNYGRHIVIDHGLGVMTFYLHLSKIIVKQGDLVKNGQNIALTGQTGYAEGPHLHLSLRIYNISVDPMKFIEIFK